ncbi:MAG: hypothetical protein KKF44_01325 [Nanoarchaeota archaeon]|nr:hypothetical protein [Nanoarchaeota archaeon]
MNNKTRLLNQIFAVTAVFAVVAMVALAADDDVPAPLEELTRGTNERFNDSQFTAAQVNAEAGNVTQLTLYGHSVTKRWQGYYGDITGTITLDDAQNWTMYDWYVAEPKGEIYAIANTSGVTPTWSTVECFNYTSNLATWEFFYNMTWNDVDGINETFNYTTHPEFSVGTYNISANTCPSTYTYMNDNKQTDKFVEVLLQTDSDDLVYMTIIENDDQANNTGILGFDNTDHDFQMLVAEDGTSGNGNDDYTTYWFYIDLE